MRAQDVTVAPLDWTSPSEPAGQLPVFKRARHPDFPVELKNTPDFGYVTGDVFVGKRGTIQMWQLYGSLPAYLEAVNEAEKDNGLFDSREVVPAMRDGHPVNAYVRLCVVFNPRTASRDGPEATPRLLRAALVSDPAMNRGNGNPAFPPRIVWATVLIDERGVPTEVSGVHEEDQVPIKASLKGWLFSPARHEGRPVAQAARVPFILVAADVTTPNTTVPPRVTYQSRPVYPMALRRSGMRGAVVVDFVVDPEGEVRDAFVIKSLNPAFDEPALDAVREWKFEPGTHNGTPTFTHMEVPIYFSIDDLADGGRGPLDVERSGDMSKLPEALRVDVDPKVLSLVLPIYPYDLLRSRVDGTARVNYLVDETGAVVLTKVVKADRPEFGLSLQAAIERFECEPALKGGRPHVSVVGFEQDFGVHDSRLVSADDDRLLRMETNHPDRIIRNADLDAPLHPIITRPPIFPRSLAKDTRGSAVVEVLIDETGRSRLPRIISASDPAFGYAAVQAVALWTFAAPTSKGHAVVTRARIPFDFKTTAKVPAPSKTP